MCYMRVYISARPVSFHPQTFSNTKRKDHISPHHLTTTPIPISLFAVSWFPHLCVTCLCHCSSFPPSLPSHGPQVPTVETARRWWSLLVAQFTRGAVSRTRRAKSGSPLRPGAPILRALLSKNTHHPTLLANRSSHMPVPATEYLSYSRLLKANPDPHSCLTHHTLYHACTLVVFAHPIPHKTAGR